MLAVVTCDTGRVVHVDVRVDAESLGNLTRNTVWLDVLDTESLRVLAVPRWLAAVEVVLAPVACKCLLYHSLKLCGQHLVVGISLNGSHVGEALLQCCARLVAEQVAKGCLYSGNLLATECLVEGVELVPVLLQLLGADCDLLDCPVCCIRASVPAYDSTTL